MADNTQNNSTGSSGLDSFTDWLSGGQNNNQTTVPSATPQPNSGMNIQQLLGGVLQAGGQGLQGLGNMVNPQQSPAMQTAMQKAATKQVQTWADTHAQNSDPMTLAKYLDSQPQPGQGGNTPMTGGQTMPQITPQQAQTLQGLPGVGQPGQSSSPQTGQSTGTPPPPPPDAIQEQARQIALQKPGALMTIFRGIFESNKSKELENLKTAQEITQGGPPLSPAERATATGAWNSALLQQHKDFQSDLSEQMKANVDAQTAFIKNTPLPSKAADWTNYNAQLQQYSTNAYQISGKMQQGYQKFARMALTNPATGQKGKPSYNVGDKVSYNGKDRIIKSINEKTGKAILSD